MGAPRYPIAEWFVDGTSVTGTNLGQVIVTRAGRLTKAGAYLRTDGSSSTHIIDVNLNGTTIFAAAAKITLATTDGVIWGTITEPTTVAVGDILTYDVDQAQAGTPVDLTVVVEIEEAR